MATLTISVPDDVKAYVEAQVGEEFADGGAFIAELVKLDQDRQIEELRAIVEEADRGGISDRTTKEIFAEAVAMAKARGIYRE